MSKREEKALRESIKHWEVDVLGKGEYPDNPNCPMCKLQKKKNEYGYDCGKCILDPICSNQFQDYIERYDGHGSTRKKYARIVIKAMKSLLPKEAQ